MTMQGAERGRALYAPPPGFAGSPLTEGAIAAGKASAAQKSPL